MTTFIIKERNINKAKLDINWFKNWSTIIQNNFKDFNKSGFYK